MNTKGDVIAYITGSIEFVKQLQEKEEHAKVHASTVQGMLENILKEVKKLSE